MQRNLDSAEVTRRQQQQQQSALINTTVPVKRTNEAMMKFKEILSVFIHGWKWFVLALIVASFGAYYYIRTTPKQYRAFAALMIKADEKELPSDEVLNTLGITPPSVNITNEIMVLRTNSSIEELVKRLNLTTNYYKPSPFVDEVAYGATLPVALSFPGLSEVDEASLTLDLNSDSTVQLSNMKLNGVELDGKFRARLGTTIKSPLGNIKIAPTAYYVGGQTATLLVERVPMRAAVANVSSRLSAHQRNERASIIDIFYIDYSRPRAEDIISTLVGIYNENWIKDRNMLSSSTSDFIRERLALIEAELGEVDTDISNFKSSRLILDPGTVGAQAYGRMTGSEDTNRELDTRLYMVRYLRNLLSDGMHELEQLPVNSGIGNGSIEGQVAQYNNLLLTRNNHLAISSEQNPLVMDIDQKLRTLKASILASLNNEEIMLNTQKQATMQLQSQSARKVAASPHESQHLLSIERQQKVKESLYMFLLQKREENQLSQAFTAYTTRLIEQPRADAIPMKPDVPTTILMAIGLGLAIPAAGLLLVDNFNTAVRGRKDLETLTIPFVGEIPQAKVGEKDSSKLEVRKQTQITDNKLVVRPRSRTILNEAFRVVRTNLEFILGFEGGHHVVMLTSMNPGSGKTFITANLSTSLAIKGKKVIAVDLDMRKASLSKYVGSPSMGVSNYISAQVADYRDVIVPLGDLDVLPVGTIPPNPTELLFNPRFNKMMEELKEQYDYVFLDCPPVEIVADAAIISRHAEMTLFVVRAHVLDRTFLPDIQKWYDEGRFPALSLLLNGTHDEFSHYGYRRYGGRYGYGYGYGSYGSYGYGNTSDAADSDKKEGGKKDKKEGSDKS